MTILTIAACATACSAATPPSPMTEPPFTPQPVVQPSLPAPAPTQPPSPEPTPDPAYEAAESALLRAIEEQATAAARLKPGVTLKGMKRYCRRHIRTLEAEYTAVSQIDFPVGLVHQRAALDEIRDREDPYWACLRAGSYEEANAMLSVIGMSPYGMQDAIDYLLDELEMGAGRSG